MDLSSAIAPSSAAEKTKRVEHNAAIVPRDQADEAGAMATQGLFGDRINSW